MVFRSFVLLIAIFMLFEQTSLLAQSKDSFDYQKPGMADRARYLNQFEQMVIVELNKVRSDPSKYANIYLAELLHSYKGKVLITKDHFPVRTKEGVKALEECISELKRTAPLPLLVPSPGLSQAARVLVDDQQTSGNVGHSGQRGSTLTSRVEKYGKWTDQLAENITYGGHSPQRVVIDLLIDDDQPDRGHRKNILNKSLGTIGVAVGYHPKYKIMCVMDMAGSFQYK